MNVPTTETVDVATGEITAIAEGALPAAVPPPGKRAIVPSPERTPRPRRSRSDEIKAVSEIASAIAKITAEVGVVAKQGENKFHGYKYARISDVLIQLTPKLAQHGIVIIQTELERSMFDEGNVLSVQYEFTICHASGEIWPEKPRQTGVCRCRDSKGNWDDKSFNKAHTAARKYFLLALFQIATGDADAEDADREDSNPYPQRQPPPRRARKPADNVMREQASGPATLTGADSSEVVDAYNKQQMISDNIREYPAAPSATHGSGAAATAALPAEVAAGAAPPSPTDDGAAYVPPPTLGAALVPPATFGPELSAEWVRLNFASEEGMDKLRAVWNTVPVALRPTLEYDKETVFKVRAREVDAANKQGGF